MLSFPEILSAGHKLCLSPSLLKEMSEDCAPSVYSRSHPLSMEMLGGEVKAPLYSLLPEEAVSRLYAFSQSQSWVSCTDLCQLLRSMCAGTIHGGAQVWVSGVCRYQLQVPPELAGGSMDGLAGSNGSCWDLHTTCCELFFVLGHLQTVQLCWPLTVLSEPLRQHPKRLGKPETHFLSHPSLREVMDRGSLSQLWIVLAWGKRNAD